MFGVFRTVKATRACVAALRPVIDRPEMLGPWPPKFWYDPYVLGFIVGTIALVSMWATGNTLKSVQSGNVLIGTFKELGGFTPDLTKRLETFVRDQNPDYWQGVKNAEKVTAYVLGINTFDHDPDVEMAAKLAAGSSLGPVDRAAIGGSLMHLLFHTLVKQRLGS